MTDSEPDIAIIGGCGHVGLPLGVKLALAGFRTTLVDLDAKAVAKVRSGRFPFLEEGGDEQLARALEMGLRVTDDREQCRAANVFIFVAGTPIDEHLNPKISVIHAILDEYDEFLDQGDLVIMRSTLFPGTMEHVRNRLESRGRQVDLSYCPERVAQGFGLTEIERLPQIVSAFDETSFERANAIFSRLAPSIVRLSPIEAELTKLFANSWRYLEFAIANEFYMIAEQHGVDFQRVYQAIRYDYPRASNYRSPGFAAGPCLFKDTMQLASFVDHHFHLGHAAMIVNEGLAEFAAKKVVAALGGSIVGKKVALLGMAFKADNDDLRASLSFRVKKCLEFKGAEVLCHDPFLEDSPPLDEVLDRADAAILGVPHREYRGLTFDLPLVDVWGCISPPEIEILPGTSETHS